MMSEMHVAVHTISSSNSSDLDLQSPRLVARTELCGEACPCVSDF